MTSDLGPVIGFIGLGLMGRHMAANLQKAGYRLVVHDIRREAVEPHLRAGAVWADTPRALTEQSEVIFTSLPGLDDVESVAFGPDGILSGLGPGKAYFDTSTNSIALVKKLDAAMAKCGAYFLDAPVSGGQTAAQKGILVIWVGGDKAIFDRHEPILRVMGDRTMYVGAAGAGTATKIINNCCSMSLHPLLAEAFMLGVKAGADPLNLWAAIRQGSAGRRRTFDGLADRFLPGDYDPPQGTLNDMYKDLTIATGLGRELGVPMRFANLALADVTEAINRGWGGRDGQSVMLLAQDRTGIKIGVDREATKEVFSSDPPAPSDPRHAPSRW